jgi:hypothetical protein
MSSNKVDKIVTSILQNKFTDETLNLDNFSLVSDIKSEINTGTDFSYEKEDSIQNYDQESIITKKTIQSNNSNNSNNSNSITDSLSKKSAKDYISKDYFPKEFINNTATNIVKKTDHSVNKKILIDVAVLCQEYTNVETMCDDNIINLDEISISTECFQQIFYPYCENFGINKEYVCCNEHLYKYISFLPEYRNVCRNKFYLLEAIIANIEKDLNISRNCFTKESLVELTNEMISIKSLCDINCCSVLASLTWCNIIEIINNYKLIKNGNCKCPAEKDCSCNFGDVIPILVINIIFKTPTEGVRNTIVRFNYRITDL